MEQEDGTTKLTQAGLNLIQQALSIWRAANNQRWCALCYTNLGLLAIEQQQWQEAHAHLTESRALIMQQGIHHFLPEVTYALGEVALGQGDYAGALALAQEAVEQARTLAMKLEEALALRTQGKAALALADLAGATRALDASLQLLQAQDNRYEMARTLEQLHRLATAEGNGAQARRYAEQATALLVALNVRHPSC